MRTVGGPTLRRPRRRWALNGGRLVLASQRAGQHKGCHRARRGDELDRLSMTFHERQSRTARKNEPVLRPANPLPRTREIMKCTLVSAFIASIVLACSNGDGGGPGGSGGTGGKGGTAAAGGSSAGGGSATSGGSGSGGISTGGKTGMGGSAGAAGGTTGGSTGGATAGTGGAGGAGGRSTTDGGIPDLATRDAAQGVCRRRFVPD